MKKITFFVRDDLKSNSAAAIRLRHLVTGFEGNGYRVSLLSAHSTTRFGKIIAYINLYFRSVVLKDEAFLYGELLLPRFFGCFLFAQHVYAERTEYPFYKITQLKKIKRLLSQFYPYSLRGVDTFITCSSALSDYYRTYLNNSDIKVVPFIVDKKFFDYKPNIINQSQLCYCGYMGNNKDGVEDLIVAFSDFVKSGEAFEHKLILMGSAEPIELEKLKDRVESLGLSKKIIFTGLVSHQEVLTTLNESGLLLLIRPNSLQAQGGFPSKLGEYMSTGRPIICTDVGEIREILGDEFINFTPADKPEMASHLIADIFNNYDHYVHKAKIGKEFSKKFTPYEIVKNITNKNYD